MSIIDYAKLNVFELLELKECMERNQKTLIEERDMIAGRLADKKEELRQLEEIEMLMNLGENCIEYLEEEIKKREI